MSNSKHAKEFAAQLVAKMNGRSVVTIPTTEFDNRQTFDQIKVAAKNCGFDYVLIKAGENRLFACNYDDFDTLYNVFKDMM